MKKAKLFFSLVVTMFLLGIIEAVSGFILWLALPSGNGWGRLRGLVIEPTYWTLSRHEWISIHDWAAVALVAIAIIHVALHWRWIVRMLKNIANPVQRRSAALVNQTVE